MKTRIKIDYLCLLLLAAKLFIHCVDLGEGGGRSIHIKAANNPSTVVTPIVNKPDESACSFVTCSARSQIRCRTPFAVW
eukprot:m.234213 g.234213  ORF g.234213 m.234213 type:complete len:79 (-) comp13913_c1_seq1:431-667(-)